MSTSAASSTLLSPEKIIRYQSQTSWNVESQTFYRRALPDRQLTEEQVERAQKLANVKPSLQPRVEPTIKRIRLPPVHLGAGETAPPSTPASWWILPSAPAVLSVTSPSVTTTLTTPSTPATTSVTASPTPQKSAKADAAAKKTVQAADWEQKALTKIKQSKWSLDKTLSHTSWKQKTSNDVRLKLLKDDGYDICDLQRKGTTADEIIVALLKHIGERKQRQRAPSSGITKRTGNKRISTTASQGHGRYPVSAKQRTTVQENSTDEEQSISMFQAQIEKRPLFTTWPLAPQKRKHSHEEDDVAIEKCCLAPCTCGVPYKRPCSRAPGWEKKEMRVLTKDDSKRQIAREIFERLRKTRKSCQQLFANPMETSVMPEPDFVPKPPSAPSRIIFQAPSPPARKPTDADIYIKASGIRLIVENIKQNATEDANGDLWMQDPEVLEDQDGDSLMEDFETETNPFTHHIRISSNNEHPVVIEGETRALMGLTTLLRDGSVGLSDTTQEKLKKIESILDVGQDAGGIEVRIGNMDNRSGSPYV